MKAGYKVTSSVISYSMAAIFDVIQPVTVVYSHLNRNCCCNICGNNFLSHWYIIYKHVMHFKWHNHKTFIISPIYSDLLHTNYNNSPCNLFNLKSILEFSYTEWFSARCSLYLKYEFIHITIATYHNHYDFLIKPGVLCFTLCKLVLA